MRCFTPVKIFAALPLPPPIHGSTVMNNLVLQFLSKKEKFCVGVAPLNFARNIQDIGVASVYKVFLFIRKIVEIGLRNLMSPPQIVYFTPAPTGGAFTRDALISIFAKSFCPRIILHLHGKGFRRYKENSFPKRLARMAFRNAHVISLSKSLTTDLEGFRPAAIYIVPNGIPPVEIKRKAKNPETPPRLLFVSNLAKAKGVRILIEAIKILSNRGQRFSVDIVGEEFDTSAKELLGQLGVGNLMNSVRIHGPKFGDEKEAFFRAADIFVFPTLSDCFPLVILEAMNNGLPVVSTLEGAIPEIVDEGRTGFLVPPGDPIRFAEKVGILIQDPQLRAEFGSNARKKFLAEYTVDKFLKRIESVFDDVLKEKRA